MILILLVCLRERVWKMLISIIFLIISLILEVVMSNFFVSTLTDVSLFSTIYSVVALVILYPHFNNDKKFYLLAILCGVFFDILYTSTFAFNVILFIVVAFTIIMLYNAFPPNVFMTNLISFISIIIYHLFSFIVLNLFSSMSYNFFVFFNIILGSIFMTIIYTTISYYVMTFIFDRNGVRYVK